MFSDPLVHTAVMLTAHLFELVLLEDSEQLTLLAIFAIGRGQNLVAHTC